MPAQYSINNVGIVVPTMNRPDFIIRQLEYYASLKSPHPIYIADSSDPVHAARIQSKIKELEDKINIIYQPYPPGNVVGCLLYLLSLVKEKYVCSIGDDDFRVPKTLTRCAEFLELHPDFASAVGRTVTFKTHDGYARGAIQEIHDYPRYDIRAERASQRLIDYMGPLHMSVIASVIKTKDLVRFYHDAESIKDDIMRGEVLPSCLMIMKGKHKIIDSLDLVRQIHFSHFKIEDMFDILTSKDWYESYQAYKEVLVTALMATDGISHDEAEQTVKKAYWGQLSIYIPRGYRNYLLSLSAPQPRTATFRMKIADYFPGLKKIYRRKIRPFLSDQQQLHYEVLQSGSQYYHDFKSITDSLKISS